MFLKILVRYNLYGFDTTSVRFSDTLQTIKISHRNTSYEHEHIILL
ncbi:MAG: hypothetical protein ACJAQ2_002461 [Vicingaceae bacterium]|jgi:hypothetical protein